MELSKDQRKAILTIKNYLNVCGNLKYTDEYMMVEFELAIEELIESSIALKGIKVAGVKSKTDGVQSITFADGVEAWAITDNIKLLLPLPYIRLLG